MVDNSKDGALRAVQIEALVIMRIIKHGGQVFPSVATGALVGMDSDGVLQVTNSFAFPTVDSNQDGYDGSNSAAAAPRAKSNVAYQNEMIKSLKEVNVDAQSAGWYMSTSLGNFVNMNSVENQAFFQKELNEKTVMLVHDVSRSVQGTISIRAFRLSPSFMTAYKENKFTTDSIRDSGLRHQDIFTELPVTIHNSHLLTSLLHQIPSAPASKEPSFPTSLAALESDTSIISSSFAPNFDSLDLSIDPFLEKSCDLLLDSIETHHTELNNYQFYQRSLAREQAKITQWQQKRKAENAQRVITKQAPLPEDEWQRLFKLPQEPSRLETLLNSRQVEQYARQVDGFTANVTTKIFAMRSTLLPGEVESS